MRNGKLAKISVIFIFKIANFKLAAMWYKCAVYIAEEIGDKTEIAKAKRYLGNCHYRNGRFKNAMKIS